MSTDGLSLADRFRMALQQISKSCLMAQEETEARSNGWIEEWTGETDDSVDSPGGIKDQVKSHSYDWLPKCPVSGDEPPPLSQCLLDVELDLLMYHKALELTCKCEDEEGDDTPLIKRKTFEEARSHLKTIVSALIVMREQLNASSVENVDKTFREERPSGRNDRYVWEYVVLKQLMEYLKSCGDLFGQLALREHEEL